VPFTSERNKTRNGLQSQRRIFEQSVGRYSIWINFALFKCQTLKQRVGCGCDGGDPATSTRRRQHHYLRKELNSCRDGLIDANAE
jgi:hypothetical protein